MGNIRNFI